MIRLLSFFTSCFLLAFPSFSQTARSKESKEQNRSLLWKISGKDMKTPSYLFGTIHLLCPEDYFWTPAMAASLRGCREVCFEMDMDDPSVMMEVAVGMMNPDGKKLKDYFSEGDYATISAFVRDSLGMDINMLQQLKPAALHSLFASKTVSCSTPLSYEANIMTEAQKLQLDISGLEAPSEQIALLEKLETDSALLELVAMARDYQDEKKEFEKMISAYKKQDLQTLFEIMEESGEQNGDLGAFLDERNQKWISRMEDKMDVQPVFFAVGAGHLWGKKGVIELLRDEGYKVEPVR
ncbi:MAG: TraB/GumN family protein [Sphingobacteriales bacterium]|nr:MAG: TraB/GumN family protein [Sphingobacteriales bacterium]